MQMKKIDKKKIIIAIVVIVAIVLVIWGISSVLQPSIQKGNDEVGEFVIIAEDGTKVNTSEQLKKDKTVEGLQLTNITLKQKDGLSSLTAEVKNNTGEDMSSFKVRLTILNKDGGVIRQIVGSVPAVANEQTGAMEAQVTEDISNAYDFRIEKIGEIETTETTEG